MLLKSSLLSSLLNGAGLCLLVVAFGVYTSEAKACSWCVTPPGTCESLFPFPIGAGCAGGTCLDSTAGNGTVFCPITCTCAPVGPPATATTCGC